MKILRSRKNRTSLFCYLVLVLNALTLGSCVQRSNYDISVIYDPPRHINPSNLTNKWKREVGDSVVLFFESGFSNDQLEVYSGTKHVSTILKSDELFQFAKHIVLPPPDVLESNITFTINSGKVVMVQSNLYKYFSVNFKENTIVVEALDDFPYYD